MARYALIITATGVVENVIEYDGVATFTPFTGMELQEATANAEIGGTWNGSEFIRAVVPEVPIDEARIRVLMKEVKTTKKVDLDNGDEENRWLVDKTMEEIISEKTELLILLHSELAVSDLNLERTQTMLRLERE